jgi:hypothetical protein
MKGTMKKKITVCAVALLLCAGAASAQFGFGVVYDPTNYQNALLRYYQLQQHLLQLQKTYNQVVAHYNLALQMARNIENMPARYKSQFAQWKNTFAGNTYGNTGSWVIGINSGQLPMITTGYRQSTTQLLPYNGQVLAAMNEDELARVQSQYASVELSDGINLNSMQTIGAIRANAQTIENQLANLEQDSFSADPNLNTEVSVLNKINAANMLTLRTVQDSNKLLASLLEQQTILAKQQREATTNTINADITRRASLSGNIAQATGTLTDSLQNFRMP